MKVNELPFSTNLVKIKVKLPNKALKACKDFAGGEKEMYICGGSMGKFFMSPDAPEAPNRRLYPLPPQISIKDILKWEVSNAK